MNPGRDFLFEHLATVPAFRALLRSVEARMIASLDLPGPILDLGCGDGTFAEATFTNPLDAGIDPSPVALAEARKRGMHKELRLGEGGRLPFDDHSFSSVMSNSVLEHISDVDSTLAEVRRVLRPGGLFVFTTPSQHFAEYLFFADLFRSLGLKELSRRYQAYFNRISWHYRTDSHDVWAERLAISGFRIRSSCSYFSRSASHAFDLLHYYSAPTLLYRKLLRRWIIAPWRWNFVLIEPLLRRWYNEPRADEGAYLYFMCERM